MSVTTDLAGAENHVLQAALGAYSDEAYTNAKKLSGTGIVGDNPDINTDTETFIGQLRWRKPLNPTVNVASLTDPAPGVKSNSSASYLGYVKTVRTNGAEKVNLAQVVTSEDGLAKHGRDFAETRAQDEHDAILSVLKGVAISEALNGAAAGSGQAGLGGQTFENEPKDARYGFYVDLGSSKAVVPASATAQGAARAEGFLNAFGMAYKDYEPEYAYLVTSPEVMASLRSANLVDQDGVTDGNVVFSTIFNGKFRLLQTRAAQGMSAAERTKLNTGAGVDIVGSKTSFIVLPGALAMRSLSVPTPVEIGRDANAYNGGGSTCVWYRWGYVLHPAGYSWVGAQDAFPENDDYKKVIVGSTPTALTVAADDLANARGTWERKSTSALSLGILPIFHG
jgi:hypothetical protein